MRRLPSPTPLSPSEPRPAGAPAFGHGHLHRFGPYEIAFHWAVVLPYVAVASSGVASLLQKNLGVTWISPSTLLDVHLGAGLALLVIPILVLAASPPAPFVRNLRECLRWGLADLWWLHASPLRVFIPRLRLPREGRFNPGQKLNLLHVAFLVPVVSGTGVTLWIAGQSLLLVRLIHLGGATLSIVLAAGHVYLAVAHPSTRKAIGGMFHGRVSEDYAERHHPLWFESETGRSAVARRHEHGPSRRSPVAVMLLGLPAMALLLGAGWGLRGGLGGFLEPVGEALAPYRDEPRRLLLPAPLHPLHSAERDLARCTACHDLAGAVSREKCLGCHGDVRMRLETGSGYHGSLRGKCQECHRDHRNDIVTLDDRSFQHDLAAFPLRGAHRQLECAACHANDESGHRAYIGLDHSSCADCHESPHDPSPEQSCSHCHSETRWSDILSTFSHAGETGFSLAGAHTGIACAACHGPDVGKLVLGESPTTCDSCHADVAAAFRGEFGVSGATTRSTALPMASPHLGELECTECHGKPEGEAGVAGPRTPEGPTRCRECHPADYDALAIDWQQRVAKILLAMEDRRALSLWRRAAVHNWEGVVRELRRRREE